MMVADGGAKDLTYKQILDARFPMAAPFGVQIDKEMTTFAGATHVDNLTGYYKLLRAQLLEPGLARGRFRASERRSHQRYQSGTPEQ